MITVKYDNGEDDKDAIGRLVQEDHMVLIYCRENGKWIYDSRILNCRIEDFINDPDTMKGFKEFFMKRYKGDNKWMGKQRKL